MSLYYPIPQPTIADNILVRRERRLPVPGEVLVKAGSRVEPDDIIAQSVITSDPVQVSIAADLGLSPSAAAKRLRVTGGQPVEQGAVLAQKGGLGSRVSRSPVTGTFTSYDPATGIGLIALPVEPVTVHAHLRGIVTDLIPYYGAVIETPATVIRGIFGMGGERHGVLKVLAAAADEPITLDVVDSRVTYALVLGGSEITADVLHRMIEHGARGVITGSIRSTELAAFLGHSAPASDGRRQAPDPRSPAPASGPWALGSSGWTFPPATPGLPARVPPDFVLIITEGFGSVPMSARTFETLAAYDGQEIAVEGTTRLRESLSRPEIIIPMSRTTQVNWLDEAGPKLAVGTWVRLLSPDYLGQIGQVSGLPVGPRAAQSGVLAAVADVDLGRERLRVPIVDLEVLK